MSDNFLRKINPCIKIICFLLFIIFNILIDNIYVILSTIIILILLLIINKISIKLFLKNALFFMPIILILLIDINLFLKAFSIIIYFIMINLTTPLNEMVYGFNQLLCRKKISNISIKLSKIIKFIPTYIDNLDKINKSYKKCSIYFKNLKFKNKFDYLKELITTSFNLTKNDLNKIKRQFNIKLYTEKSLYKIGFIWTNLDIYILLIHFILIIIMLMRG